MQSMVNVFLKNHASQIYCRPAAVTTNLALDASFYLYCIVTRYCPLETCGFVVRIEIIVIVLHSIYFFLK